jgi:hypothetical protein
VCADQLLERREMDRYAAWKGIPSAIVEIRSGGGSPKRLFTDKISAAQVAAAALHVTTTLPLRRVYTSLTSYQYHALRWFHRIQHVTSWLKNAATPPA